MRGLGAGVLQAGPARIGPRHDPRAPRGHGRGPVGRAPDRHDDLDGAVRRAGGEPGERVAEGGRLVPRGDDDADHPEGPARSRRTAASRSAASAWVMPRRSKKPASGCQLDATEPMA